MSARTGMNVDIIQTKSLYFRNLGDNAAISTKYVLYADGSGGTFWSSLYIENIPGFSSFYNSTIALCSTTLYLVTNGISTYYESTLTSFGNSLSSLSTIFDGASIPQGVYSTVVGLGTVGYVSSQTLNRSLQSTVAGLGTVGYVSSQTFNQSLQSTVTGLGTVGYVSSQTFNQSLQSTVAGLGTVGYVSSQTLNISLQSTIASLGTLGYVSSQTFISSLQSTVAGLGTVGYVSSQTLISSLQSTVGGLGTIGYVSSQTLNRSLQSTVTGLGTFGYVSSQTLGAALQSTVIGANLVSSLSSCQFQSLAIKVISNGFEYTSSGTRVAFITSTGSFALGNMFMPSSGITLDVNGLVSFRSNVYVYPGGLSIGKPVGNTVNAELDVSGNILATNVFIAGQGIFNGSIIAAQYLTSSDSNLKKDIETYRIGNNVWSSIRGVRFNWRSNDREDIGFIAQELQELIPESVTSTNNGRLVIDPTKIIPLLVETVKELKAKVSEMDERLKRLEN